MAKDPAVLFYTSDFLTGTMLMSNEQKGKYITLLCLQHQKNILSEDDMIKICSSYDKDVFDKFKKTDEGYYNERMRFEHDKRVNFSKSRSENRLKGINNQKDTKEQRVVKETIISSSYDNHMENENENENINRIIDYLNKVCGSDFRKNTPKTKTIILSRLKEGFTAEDFEVVISHKFSDWGNDQKMSKFLRPETLFGNKFEGYLQTSKSVGSKKYKCTFVNHLGEVSKIYNEDEYNKMISSGGKPIKTEKV